MIQVLLTSIVLFMTCTSAQSVPFPPTPNKTINEHIVGGYAVPNITDVPYIVSMMYKGNHICGGSIISPLWILTAAHCMGNPVGNITFRAGSIDRQVGGVEVAASQMIRHENYSSATFNYDIGVYKLKTALNFSAGLMKAVALPVQGQAIPVGQNTLVSGWGTLTNGGTSIPRVLYAVVVPTVNITACKAIYGSSAITSTMLCAGYATGGKDSCQGDSGGPLVANTTTTQQLLGIVSWGNGCALAKYYGVYTSVPSLRNWIKNNTGV